MADPKKVGGKETNKERGVNPVVLYIVGCGILTLPFHGIFPFRRFPGFHLTLWGILLILPFFFIHRFASLGRVAKLTRGTGRKASKKRPANQASAASVIAADRERWARYRSRYRRIWVLPACGFPLALSLDREGVAALFALASIAVYIWRWSRSSSTPSLRIQAEGLLANLGAGPRLISWNEIQEITLAPDGEPVLHLRVVRPALGRPWTRTLVFGDYFGASLPSIATLILDRARKH